MDQDFTKTIESVVPDNSLVISAGLPGSWKSPVTEELARLKGFCILRSDVIRLEVLKGQDIFDSRVASDPENRRKVYEEMFRQAGDFLKTKTEGLILDATFFTRELRSGAAELANKAKRLFVIAECVCTEERSIGRILKRTKENYESNALTREAYLNNKALFEPIDLSDLKTRFQNLSMIHLVIDTEHDTPIGWRIRKIEIG
jgi:hypothetical protein